MSHHPREQTQMHPDTPQQGGLCVCSREKVTI